MFLVALASFELSFVTSLFLNYNEGLMRWCAAGLASAMTLFCFWHWGMIMEIAGKLALIILIFVLAKLPSYVTIKASTYEYNTSIVNYSNSSLLVRFIQSM